MTESREMVVLVEAGCRACVKAVRTAVLLRELGIVTGLVVIDRSDDPGRFREFGVSILPAVFINRRLAVYGEFSVDDIRQLCRTFNHDL